MESSISLIIKTAIELDELLIEKYLIEEQNKSSDSPPIFFGKLLSLVKAIKQEHPNPIKWFFLDTSCGWFDEVGLINRALSTEALGFESSENIYWKHLEELCRRFDLVADIVNRLFEQSKSDTEVKPNPDSSKEEVPLENKFNTMSMEQVRSFFMPLVTKKNRGGKHWMTEDDFEIFLKTSFLKIDLSKPNINIGKSDKGAIKKLFFLFYEKCLIEFISENNSKDRFVTLLKNAFNILLFDDLTNDTFQKRDSKYEWGT